MRRWLLPALVPLALLLGLAASQALRDAEPPRLFVEAPERVEADAPFDLRVSANEPVTFSLRYGALEVERVSQILELSLLGEAGRNEIEIRAEDGAGNVSEASHAVQGVVVPEVRLEAPDALAPGAAYTVTLAWEPEDARLRDVELSVGGEPLRAHREAGEAFAFDAVPLGTEPTVLEVRARWRDGMGRFAEAAREIEVEADDRPIQELRLSPEVLAVSTPEARVEEAAALEAAYARANPAPVWREPFRLPVKGYGTSGFGLARRYGPGGNVSRHGGEDIGAPAGTPVLATNAGEVRLARFFPIKGGFVMIDHGGGVNSQYLHLSTLSVEEGQSVEAGEQIGEVGSTGLSTGPHLHWEMRVGEVATNPLLWVGRVRP